MKHTLAPPAVLIALAPLSAAQSPLLDELRWMLPSCSAFSRAMALGDLDGDGDLDVFVGTDAENRLFLNDGAGTFRDGTHGLPEDVEMCESVALGDVDGDGDLDALIATVFFSSRRLYLNDGTATFTDGSDQLPASTNNTAAVALGDVDGDGDLDAVLGNEFGQPAELYRNDGTGVFADASGGLPHDGGTARDVDLADVDGDGDLDLFVTMYAENRLYTNDGAGVFADATDQLPADAELSNRKTAFADVDGDGDLDALLVSGPRLYRNDGSGTFELDAGALPASADSESALAVLDVDGDRDLDVLTASSGRESVYRNDGAGLFTHAPLAPVEDASFALVAGDFDRDGDPDCLVGSSTSERLYLNDGAGGFVDVSGGGLEAEDASGRDVALADLDGDGDLDVFVANDAFAFHGIGHRVALNDGTGMFGGAWELPDSPPSSSAAVALGDVDGDGDLDAFLAHSMNNPSFGTLNALWLGDGEGAFTDASERIPAHDGHAVALGDLDGDGDLDAVVGQAGIDAPHDRVYWNDGRGSFLEEETTLGDDETEDVVLADVDADGDLDVVTVSWGVTRLWRNDAGALTEVANAFTGSGIMKAGAADDVDGDGDLDLLLVGLHPSQLHLGDGKGGFTEAPGNVPFDFPAAFDVALADFDGDGDLDAVLGVGDGFADHGTVFYGNDGSGVFTQSTAELAACDDVGQGLAAADIDADGDTDLVLVDHWQDRVYTNVTRQLARRAHPRVGRPLTFDLYAAANGTWALAVARELAPVALPELGVLHLDPATLRVVARGTFDEAGRSSVTFDVPADAALAGITLHWQALLGTPLRLTNLERTELLAL